MEETLKRVKNKGQICSSSATYCVTGGTGYIGSWLVEALLERGYTVHATVRDPEKSLHLLSLWTRGDRLKIFKADLNEAGSFDEAVKGCDGVFHVAASMEFNVVEKENIEAHVQANIIDPAIRGTINLLKSCLNSNSVKRVVFTSSISTITAKDCNGKWKPIVDESCQIKTEQVVKTQASGWVYALSKHLTEEAAFKFAKENGIDLVSVITTTVAGPFFTARVPSSVKVLLSPITGEPEFFNILSAVNARIGSIAFVHIEDICNAHIFLMEHSKAEGRYICSSQSCPMSMLVNLLAKEYSYSNKRRISEKNYDKIPSEISSKKLKDLGFCYKYELEDTIHQTVVCCLDYANYASKRAESITCFRSGGNRKDSINPENLMSARRAFSNFHGVVSGITQETEREWDKNSNPLRKWCLEKPRIFGSYGTYTRWKLTWTNCV